METTEKIKEMVRQKYSEIALQDKEDNQASCCGSGCCTTEVYNIMYAGCVAGAIQKQAYLELIDMTGFKNVTFQKEKPIIIPDDILSQYLSPGEIAHFKQSGTGIHSLTVYGEKTKDAPCCAPGCCS